MTYANQIREFIINNLLFGDGSSLTDDLSFLDGGIVDSTGMLELIMFLETTYGIKVEPQETVPQNLDSVNRMAHFVTRKLSSAAPPGVVEGELGSESLAERKQGTID